MNFSDIQTNSPKVSHKKYMETNRENVHLDIGAYFIFSLTIANYIFDSANTLLELFKRPQ